LRQNDTVKVAQAILLPLKAFRSRRRRRRRKKEAACGGVRVDKGGDRFGGLNLSWNSRVRTMRVHGM
jgi:hypothetical protein